MHDATQDRPLILNFAPTGEVPTKTQNAYLPATPKEIVADVLAAAKTGITIAHIHARDDDGAPTANRDVYARIIGGIRERRPDLVLSVSTSGRRGGDLRQRLAVLDLPTDLLPDMASLTLASHNFAREACVNSPDTIRAMAERMAEQGVKPELEILDLGMANVIGYLWRKDLLTPPFYANLFFGGLASPQADLASVTALMNAVPGGQSFYPMTYCSLAGIGAAQLPIAAHAAASAHGVRIGLEDNLWMDPRRCELASNAVLVKRVHRLAEAVGRQIMRPASCRALLGLPGWGHTTIPIEAMASA